MSRRIVLRLDLVSEAALRVLTSDGTGADEAVQAAIVDAAERKPIGNIAAGTPESRYQDRILRLLSQVDGAPPLSVRQQQLLESVFGVVDSDWNTGDR